MFWGYVGSIFIGVFDPLYRGNHRQRVGNIANNAIIE